MLKVTFTSVSGSVAVGAGWTETAPVPLGRKARSEQVEITSGTAGSSAGALTAAADENIAVVLASADCWVIFGDAAELSLEPGDGHFVKADTYREFGLIEGDRVAVIAA